MKKMPHPHKLRQHNSTKHKQKCRFFSRYPSLLVVLLNVCRMWCICITYVGQPLPGATIILATCLLPPSLPSLVRSSILPLGPA